MKGIKKVALVLLSILSLGVLAYFGSVLTGVFFPVTMQPQMLDTEALFEETAEPVQETPEQTQELPEEELPVPEEVEPEPIATEKTAAQKAAEYLSGMTLEEKLWQMIFTTPDDLTGVPGATQAGEMTRQALQDKPVGGLCYFSPNIEDREQLTALLSGTAAFSKIPVFLSVDEEGGIVTRLSGVEDLGVADIGPAADFGTAGDPAAVYAAGSTLAGQMKDLGFNVNFAPVADLTVEGNTELATRTYSSDPQVVGSMVVAMTQAMQENGIAATLKHFPGHGSVQSDSHEGKAVSEKTPEQLRSGDWISFRQGIDAGAKFVMMSHLTNEHFSPHPASLSPEVISCLRQELGFEGVIITDSLKMRAIIDHYTSAQAAVMAIAAGCDMILMPNDLTVAFDGLVNAVLDDTITRERIDESVLRILTVKYEMGLMQ